MKKKYPIILFVVIQLMAITCLTLWIIWYQLGVTKYEGIIAMVTQTYSHLDLSVPGVGKMILGIVFMSIIIIGSFLMFLEWIKTRNFFRQGMDFVSAFTHELMTPLTSIQMNLEAILDIESMSNSKRKELLRIAYAEAKRLEDLINKILSIKAVEHKGRLLKRTDFKVSQFFDEYHNHIKSKFDSMNVTYKKSCSENCYFNIDYSAIVLVLDNIVDNALKYSSASSKIEFNVNQNSKFLEITVRDYGNGISKKNLKKIFKIFFRENAKIRGTGIGLYVSNTILKWHGGKIWATNPNEGHGTIMNLKIPVKEIVE